MGLKSDLPEFLLGPPGARWVLVSSGRQDNSRGTLRLRPEGKAAASFQVQAGAFSQEEPARARLAQLSETHAVPGSVAFSAERGVYRVLLGRFSSRAEAEAFVQRLSEVGHEAIVTEGAPPETGAVPPTIAVTGEEGGPRRFASPLDLFPGTGHGPVQVDGKPYRGALRVFVNPRGTLSVVNLVDLEEYLYGVVPAEMGPRRYDAIEALKAQAVAARTYALAHRGQFEAEGYDLCATPKCQVYAGRAAEDPLSNDAVDATRGLVLAHQGRFADALFVSTCGGRTENVENVFGETAVPYLVSVECSELATSVVVGARTDRTAARPRRGMEWRGYVLRSHAPRKRATRAAQLETALGWAGLGPGEPGGATRARAARPPAALSPQAVYPSLLATFDLTEARLLHLLPRDQRYYAEPPAASGGLSGTAREAYDFLLRFRFGAGEALPPPPRNLTEEEYGGLLLSAALRLQGITEASGKFLSREGSHVWVKTTEGRADLPLDPEMPLARKVGDSYFVASALTLRAGDRLRWWKRGAETLALWVELDAVGPAFERESAWTEWVRRISGRELARRMAARVAGTEVREVSVTRRTPSGRAVELRVRTDTAEATFHRFELRQALELPEMLFTVKTARGAQGELEFLFLGRGWGHGVGLCQNGAYGMALPGATYDKILRHYYTGIDIVQASSVTAGPPSNR
ncbi:MAG: SpoIID/LytB domain-containing protein [Thermoanaerobaculia bacterium]